MGILAAAGGAAQEFAKPPRPWTQAALAVATESGQEEPRVCVPSVHPGVVDHT
jgi:hypothetical protein